jgi:nicotinamide-nucleotide amidase
MTRCEIIATGTELLLGYVVNTHPSFLAPRLASLGIRVTRIITVGDDRQVITEVVSGALQRADIIIVTGGLGPTSDDVTRDVVAELLGRKLRLDAAVLRKIQARFQARKARMPKAVAVQAMVPDGALVLPNDHGSAPGLAIKANVEPEPKVLLLREPRPVIYGVLQRLVILLPGPPRELKPMFDNHVMPLLRDHGYATPAACRVFRTVGVGESWVAEMVEPLVAGLADVEVGYCARPNEVDVRLITHGSNAAVLADKLEPRIRKRLGEIVFGDENDRLEDVVVRELICRKRTLATAESCTGGLLASRVTNVSGSSGVFMEGVVCYSNEAKMRDAGVKAKTLKAHGAVSRQVARELAAGVRQRAGTDYGIGITGIAGPTGGTPKKPVGLVFIALAGPRGTTVHSALYHYDRETFKFVVTQAALDTLRRALKAS